MTLQEYVKKYSITQRSMANTLGITICHLRMMLIGKSSPSIKLSKRIEKATNSEVTKEEAIFFEGVKKK